MSNRLFQGVVHQMRDAIDRTIGVVDETLTIIACSDLGSVGEIAGEIQTDSFGLNEPFVRENNTYKAFGVSPRNEYILFVEGTDELASKYASLLAVSLSSIKQYYDEKYDRGNFIKNIIMDNILPGDIYVRAKELHFSIDAPRAVFLIRQVGHGDVAAVEVLQGIFPDRLQDFVLSINETDIAVVKQISPSTTSEDLQRLAQSMEDLLKTELFIKTVIGIGTVSSHLRELADSYKEAQTAIDVGKVFDTEKTIINYENLGIGRLIYQLPTTLCEIFLTEVFKKNSIDSLDQETLFTINKFFENNLNVSETSRKLFVHRNTLVYRLEKIKKLTGLDLRQFDHAIIFKVALMVRKYLSSRDIHTA